MAEGPIRAPNGAVAVAASAGGVEALSTFARSLPADFPGVVLIVLHLPEAGPSVLPHILARTSALRVAQATTCTRLEAGTMLVAPPGQHLRVAGQHAVLDRGPRENGHRPSADALFRSVAEAFGPRAAGVVLSGTMDDGAAGLRQIAERGGFTVVQTPTEAAFPGMPAAAIAEARPDKVCPAEAIGPALATWIAGLGPPSTADLTHDEPGTAATADPLDGLDTADPLDGEERRPGDDAELSAFTCPECGGTLRVERSHGAERFRCRVGHAFSASGLLAGKQDALEAALWAAIVALEERVDLSRRLVRRLAGTRPSRLARYREDIERATGRIELLRAVVDDLAREPFVDDGQAELAGRPDDTEDAKRDDDGPTV